MNGLAQAGLLERLPTPDDGRGIQLVVTDAGCAALARADRALTERMLQLIPPEAADSVRAVVAHLGAALDREGPRVA